MSGSVVPAVLGATAGMGLVIAVASTRRSSLRGDLDRLVRGAGDSSARLGIASMATWMSGRRGEARRRDLAVMDLDPMRYEQRRLTLALGGVALPVLAALLLPAIDGGVAPGIVLIAGLAVGAAGFLVPEWDLRRCARRARRDTVSSLSAYLDLVTILLAGGAGLETAAQAAADAGDSRTFERLRLELSRARTTRRSMWSCLADAGRRIGVDELVELGAALEVSGRHGSRIAESLAVRADAARVRLHQEIEAEANSASERMGLPTVLLFMGFLFLLGYPAVQTILGSA